MATDEKELLKNISNKLDTLISIVKLSNQKQLDEAKKNIERDKVAMRILELSDGSITYSNLAKRVHEDTGAAEITVKKKISELKEQGIITSRREGKETYYDNSGLLGG